MRPSLTILEDRCTPASFAGNTITLDDANEVLTVRTSVSGTYTLTSTVDVNGMAGPVAFTPGAGPVLMVDAVAGAGVSFGGGAVEFAHPFAVTLDDAPAAVSFTGNSAFGVNGLSVTTARNIEVNTLANVSTTSGNITFSANRQATPTAGNFIGVDVRTSSVTSVSGTVNVSGRGGSAAAGVQTGVRVLIGATLGTTGSGAVVVTGTGGASLGNENYGVQVVGYGLQPASIRSGGGNVTVTGIGGGDNGGSSFTPSNANRGVFLNAGGQIVAGGTGAVSVTGTGGTSGPGFNAGVYVANGPARIVGNAAVSVTGTGGGTGANDAFENHGVILTNNGRIFANGSGALTVTGRGNTNGISAGTFGNVGVLVTGDFSGLYSSGPLNVDGVDGTYEAVAFQDGANVIGGPNAPVTITTDTFAMGTSGSIQVGSGTVTIQTRTPTAVISLGGGDDARHYPTSIPSPVTLGLTDADLQDIIAGTLVIGRSSTANIRLVADVTPPTSNAVQLVTAGDLRAEFTGRFATPGGPLTLAVGGSIIPTPAGNDFAAGTVSVSPGARLELEVNSATANTRLDVAGTLDLTGLGLVLSGSYTPAVGDVFTLATATSITGTLTGLPDGATVALNGVTLWLTYSATAVTATALSGPPPVRVVTAVGDTVRVQNPADGSTRVLVPFPGSRVSVASTDLNSDSVPDVLIGAGPGGGPHVRAFDGVSGAELASFFAFSPAFTGGVNLAAAGGRVVVGAGAGGGPHVKVLDATKLTQTQANGEIAESALLGNFFAFDVTFSGGVSVGIGELSFGGLPEVIVGAGAGGGPHVKVIDGNRLSMVQPNGVISSDALRASFFAFAPTFGGGVNVAATNDLFAVGTGAGIEPQVKLYQIRGGNILTDVRTLAPFDLNFRGGVRVGFANADADTDIDLLTAAGPGGGPHLKAFNLDPFTEIQSVFVGDPTDTRGVVV